MNKIYLDTETTGYAPGQIAQLSYIIEDENDNVVGKNYFFKIKYITSGAEEVCGRGLEFYEEKSGGKEFKDHADAIYDDLNNNLLIAHNLRFDENFISTEFWRINKLFSPASRYDSMINFRDYCGIPGTGGKCKNPKLEELVDSLSVDKDKVLEYTKVIFKTDDDTIGFHDARYDTTALFVALHVYENKLNNKTDWISRFCKE